MMDLGLVETSELIREMKHRYDSFIISGVPKASAIEQQAWFFELHGSLIVCLGLTRALEPIIQHELHVRPAEDES